MIITKAVDSKNIKSNYNITILVHSDAEHLLL